MQSPKPLDPKKIIPVALYTIIHREVVRFMRIWVQTLIPPAVTMSLYFLIFGHVIGQRIGAVESFDYIQFIAPGLIMMSVITNSYANVVSSFFGSKFQKSLEEMLVSPMPNWVILLGFIMGGVLRALLVGIIVALVSLIFTHYDFHHIGFVFIIAMLTAFLFATVGFINGIFAKKFDDINIVPTFVLTPLTYLGGVFYSIKMLPELAQHISFANPIFYVINAFRYGFLGVSDIDPYHALAMILIFAIAAFAFALKLLNKGVGIRG